MGHICITLLWVLLTLVLATSITTSILSPVWFKNEKQLQNENTPDTKILTFGLLRSCRRDQLVDVMFRCDFYDIFNDKHSIMWIICGSLFCIGLLLFVMCVLLLACGVCLSRASNMKYRGGLTYIQGVGGKQTYHFSFVLNIKWVDTRLVHLFYSGDLYIIGSFFCLVLLSF